MSSPDAARPAPKPWTSWLTGSDTRFALLELAAGLFLLGELVALVLFHDKLSWNSAAVLWVQWVCTAVGLRVAGFFTLFGPVLFFEMVRAARRPRYIIIRTLYACLLMLLLGWVAFIWYIEGTGHRGTVEAKQMAAFAETFFFVFAVVQGLVVVILTPAYCGGAIADEKDRRTLDFLLATTLKKREIIFGKLVSRVANLSMMILAGLPILSFLQFLGGVDPNLVLATFIATFVTMFSLAGVSLFFSVQLRKSRDAIAITYVTYAAYLALSSFLSILFMIGGPVIGAWGGFPSNVLGWESPITLADVVNFFGSGNIIACVFQLALATGGRMGVPAHELMPELLRGYVAFHLVFAVLCPLYATLRLRTIALSEKEGGGRKVGVFRAAARPPVGTFPMIWKEVFAEPGLKLNWMGRIVIVVIFLASFLPAFFILEYFFDRQPAHLWGEVPLRLVGNWLENESHVLDWFLTGRHSGNWGNRWQDPYWMLAQGMNVWARIIGSAVACLLLLAVAVRAAGSVSGEREKQTLDELLTTPLTAHSIVYAKWLGAILSVRWGMLWLLCVWLVTVAFGGMSVFAIPFVLCSWLVYATVAAGLGLCFSSWCRKTLSATVWTLATLLFLGGLHWLLAAVVIYVPLAILSSPRDLVEWCMKIQFGQTPPLVLGLLTFYRGDFEWGGYGGWHREQVEMIACSLVGLFVWGIAGSILYAYAYSLFAAMANRLPYYRPAMPRRPEPLPRHATRPAPGVNGTAILTVLPADEPVLMVESADEVPKRVRSERG